MLKLHYITSNNVKKNCINCLHKTKLFKLKTFNGGIKPRHQTKYS